MNLRILFLCLMSLVAPAFADDGQKVVERKTCDQIKSEIADLTSIGVLNTEQQAQLTQLSLQQRAYCSIKSNGRRTIARSLPTVAAPTMVAQTTRLDGLTEYLENKKANCESLGAQIDELGDDTTVAWIVKEMQKYYDADCTTIEVPDIVAETIAGAVTAQTVQQVGAKATTTTVAYDVFAGMSEEEIEAVFNANIAAGLCGDGTKPNRFGCCAGETFTDLGNATFACCPNKLSGDCFPPITKVL